MEQYLLLMNLTEPGMQQVRVVTRVFHEVRQIIELKGGRVTFVYALLGRYDLVVMLEAPDNKTMARISAMIVATSHFRVETLPAVSVDELIEK